MKSFLENFPRLAPTTSGDRTPDVAFVSHIGGEADPFPLIEYGGKHSHIRSVRTAAEIRMVGDKGITFLDFRAGIAFQHTGSTSRECSHVQWQDHVLSYDFALAVQDRAARVLGFSDDGGKAGAEKRVLHLLHDPGQTGLYDL